MEEFCGSAFWDWDLTWNTTESPDFTPCFERTVLFSVPCLFLWLLTPVDILCSYYSNGREVPWSPLMSAKLAISTVLVLLESGLLLMQVLIIPASIQDYVVYPVDIYVPTVRAATLLLSMGLLMYSRRRGVRSSGVQFLFWLFVAIVQAIRFRTVMLSDQDPESPNFLNPSIFILEVIYFPVVVGQLILHSWADMAPVYQSDFDDTSAKNSSPETKCSFLSKLLFEWYSSLIWTGYRKPLEYSDLWSLNWDMRSQNVVTRFDKHWPRDLNKGGYSTTQEPKSRKKSNSSISVLKNNQTKAKDSNGNNGNVFITFLKTFGSKILCGFFIRIVPDLLVLIQPLILNQIIAFVSTDEPTWKGILYAVILLLNALVSVIFAANGIHIFFQIGISFKSALVSAIYRKSLLLSNSAKREKSTGEIVNHMAVDVGYVADVSQHVNSIFTSPIVLGVCLYSLWNLLGIAALAGIIAMVLIMPLNAFIARIGQKLQKKLMGYKDKRTKMMSEILNGIKCIKLYAWEPSFEKQVMEIRGKELSVLKRIAIWNAMSNFLWTCSSILVAIVTFGTYVLIDKNNVLDAQTAFVSISLFNIMAQPFAIMPLLINMYIQASVGFKRLNAYLNADELDTEALSHDKNEKNPVAMENASFSWDENARAGGTLHNIDLQVKQGELVAIVGPVGCGKSSLLSSLLNELVKTSGRVNVRGRIAYVAQLAWIQNASVRDNILFGSPYDSNKYKRVIDACALTPDLEILPAGDKTEIGEKGINLSGGQKQRVSLARAVYSNADIFLLDDPLSAVDAKVGKHIFDRVLGPKGLLRGKTRLLVTHGIVHLPLMDNIVVMMDGRISETGTYQQLQDKNGAFADFLKQHTPLDSSSQEKDTQAEIRLLKQRLSSSRTMSVDSESEVSGGNMRMRRFSSKGSLASNLSQVEVNRLIESEKMETTSVSSTVYLDYFRAAGWKMVAATMLMYMGFQGFAVGGSLWLSVWTNAAAPNNGTETIDQPQNGYYFSIYGVLGVLQTTSVLLGSIIMAMGTLKSANVLHLGMLVGILRAPVQFFDVTPMGRIVNRFSKDVDSLDSILPMFLKHLTNAIFYVFGVLITISISTPLFIIVILPVGLFYYILQRVYVATSRQLKRLESTTKSPIYSHFGETVSGASTIRAYGQQERFILESERRQDHNMVSYYSIMSSNRWLQIRLELVGSTVVFFAALLAVLGKDRLSAGMVGMSISSGMYFTNCLLSLVRFTSDVETNIVAVERMKEYSQCQQEAAWNNEATKPPYNWPESGAIVFDQYMTRYRPGLDLVLKNVTCSINPGEKVGIVGRTGAGKSSVTLAIFRILEGAGGSIQIDGKDISKLGLHDVRGRLTIIPQDPMLFSSTLKMNLDPFEEKRDDELWRALELAHLKGFVDELPGGLNFEITEGGENLSVGQRQLVCLARALLRRTKILVLDEATSAVDLDTEELILKTIKTEFTDCTVITIAHRLNTIMDSDRVIVLENGQVVEVDTPQNFLANSKSVFYSMAKEAGLTEGNHGIVKANEEPSK